MKRPKHHANGAIRLPMIVVLATVLAVPACSRRDGSDRQAEPPAPNGAAAETQWRELP